MGPQRRSVACLFVIVGAACTADAPPPSPTPPSTTVAASFGPAGEALIGFHSDPAGSDDTYVMTPDGRDLAPVTEGTETIAQPFWSPDGTRMVVACCASGPGTLFLIDAPRAEPIELAPGVDDASSPAWSPDGSRIAFESSDRGLVPSAVDGEQNVYLADRATRRVRRVVTRPGGVSSSPHVDLTDISADGSLVGLSLDRFAMGHRDDPTGPDAFVSGPW